MRPRASRLLSLALVAALSSCGSPRTPEVARLEGIAFLLRSQNRDGSWGMPVHGTSGSGIYTEVASSHEGFRQAVTALACLALRRQAALDPAARTALDKGMEWFHIHASSKRPAGPVFYNNWAHIYSLQMAAEVSQDAALQAHQAECRRIMQEEIERLTSYQGGDGGWGYYDFDFKAAQPSGILSTSFMTGAALVALYEARQAGAEGAQLLVPGGFRNLDELRLGNGAYIYGIYLRQNPHRTISRPEACLSRTQAALAAREAHNRGSDEAETGRALESFLKNHHFLEAARGKPIPHESFYQNAGYYYFFGHYYACRNAARIADRSQRQAWGSRLAGILARDQGEDGSWFDWPLFGYGEIYATALAVMALEELRDAQVY